MRTREAIVRNLYLVLLMGIVACTSDPAKQAATSQRPTRDDPSKGIICTNRVPTGSSLREKKCTTPEQRELERQQAQHQTVIQSAPGSPR
jgi:hypothetical protein